MIISCEMFVSDFFKLSVGHIAFVGKIVPDMLEFIPASRADLYVGEKKIQSINILGEDRFSGGNEAIRKGKRSIRTDTDISNILNVKNDMPIKLIIYINTED